MEELVSGVVVRLSRSVAAHYPKRCTQANPTDFECSTREKKIAESEGRPARLSVFDCMRTSVAEVRRRNPQLSSRLAFGLGVVEVRDLRTPNANENLKVVRDPIDGDDSHCGIVGAHRPKGGDRRAYLKLRVRLARLTYPVNENCEQIVAHYQPK